MQMKAKNNKCNHICFVKCSCHSYEHMAKIRLNCWQKEEKETPYSVAVTADDSFRTSDVYNFLNVIW